MFYINYMLHLQPIIIITIIIIVVVIIIRVSAVLSKVPIQVQYATKRRSCTIISDTNFQIDSFWQLLTWRMHEYFESFAWLISQIKSTFPVKSICNTARFPFQPWIWYERSTTVNLVIDMAYFQHFINSRMCNNDRSEMWFCHHMSSLIIENRQTLNTKQSRKKDWWVHYVSEEMREEAFFGLSNSYSYGMAFYPILPFSVIFLSSPNHHWW